MNAAVQENAASSAEYGKQMEIASALSLIDYPASFLADNPSASLPSLDTLHHNMLRQRITTIDIFLQKICTQKSQVQQQLHICEETLNRLTHEFSALLLPRPFIDSNQLQQQRHAVGCCLSFGCRTMDAALGGGFRTNCITEVSGVSSAGKTQFCLQLLLQVQLPREFGGLDGAAVYINTENGDLPSNRLHEMASDLLERLTEYRRRNPHSRNTQQQQLQQHENNNTDDDDGDDAVGPSQPIDAPESTSNQTGTLNDDSVVDPLAGFRSETDFMDNILLRPVANVMELHSVLNVDLVQTIKYRKNIRLVIIDSIAGAFRGDFDGFKDSIQRAEHMFRIAATLKRLSDEYNLCVVLTNQVSDVMSSAANSKFPSSNSNTLYDDDDDTSPTTSASNKLPSQSSSSQFTSPSANRLSISSPISSSSSRTATTNSSRYRSSLGSSSNNNKISLHVSQSAIEVALSAPISSSSDSSGSGSGSNKRRKLSHSEDFIAGVHYIESSTANESSHRSVLSSDGNRRLDGIQESDGDDSDGESTNQLFMPISTRAVVPALGLAWSNCVNVRILLSRHTNANLLHHRLQALRDSGQYSQQQLTQWELQIRDVEVCRQMLLVFSPYSPSRACFYTVDQRGVRGLF